MEQVIFTCLTPEGTCEWVHLRDFVGHFNAISGKTYRLLKCLDVYGRGNKQPAQAEKRPEVLLEASKGDRVVIERKDVVWPNTFERDHRKEHDLLNGIATALDEQFNDTTYELAFFADDVKGKKKRQVKGFAEEIAQHIVSNGDRAKSSRGTGSRSPVRWVFRPMTPDEIDEPSPTTGIRSSVTVSSGDAELRESIQKRAAALEGFAQRFDREANRAAKKFEAYTNDLKLLVVQFFGEGDYAKDEDIVEIIHAAQLPNQIDQVWLTGREWVSIDDYELAWERVR